MSEFYKNCIRHFQFLNDTAQKKRIYYVNDIRKYIYTAEFFVFDINVQSEKDVLDLEKTLVDILKCRDNKDKDTTKEYTLLDETKYKPKLNFNLAKQCNSLQSETIQTIFDLDIDRFTKKDVKVDYKKFFSEKLIPFAESLKIGKNEDLDDYEENAFLILENTIREELEKHNLTSIQKSKLYEESIYKISFFVCPF